MDTQFRADTLPELLRDLYVAERGGLLALTGPDGEKRIWFERGLLRFADAGPGDEEFGARLVRAGADPRALSEAKRGAVSPAGVAARLLELEVLPPAALEAALRDHVRHTLGAALRWTGGRARFEDGSVPEYGLDADVVGTCQLLLEVLDELAGFDEIRDALVSVDRPLSLVRLAPVPIEALTFGAVEGFVLSRIDGTTTLSELMTIVPPGEERTTSRMVLGLLLLGLAKFDPPVADGPFRVASILRDHADRREVEALQGRLIEQVAEALGRLAPHELLGVAPDAPRAGIDRAYEAAKAPFGRDRLLDAVRERYRSELARIESGLVEAYLTLCRPAAASGSAAAGREPAGARPRLDAGRVRLEVDRAQSQIEHERANKAAEAYYAQARKAQREGDYHRAIQFGKLAVSHAEREPRYYVLLGDCQSRNPDPRWQHLAEQSYARAAELDPWNPEYPIALGRLYKRRGLTAKARKAFEDALALSPEHAAAERELDTLEQAAG